MGKTLMKVRGEFLEEETLGQSKNTTLIDLVNNQSLGESRMDDQSVVDSEPADVSAQTDTHIQPLLLSDDGEGMEPSPIRKYTDVVKSTSPAAAVADNQQQPLLTESVPQIIRGRGKGTCNVPRSPENPSTRTESPLMTSLSWKAVTKKTKRTLYHCNTQVPHH